MVFYVPANDEISGERVAGPPDVRRFVACQCFASASEGRSNTMWLHVLSAESWTKPRHNDSY